MGEAIIAKDIAQDVKDEQYLSAGLNTLALGVGAIPGAGDILNRPIRAAAKKLRRQDSSVATKMLNDIDSIETWKKQNPNPKPQKQNPSIEKAANDLLEGKITGKQYRSVVKENMPIQKIEEVPEVPSFTEIVGALDKDKSAKGIIGLNKKIKDGTRVSSRLDIPAYERFDKWVVSVHDAFDKKGRESLSGDILGYGKTAVLKNVEFKGSPTGAASISARKTDKGTIARIFGDYINAEPENVEEYARQVIKDKEWTQVGYNPFRHGFFYDKDTGMPVKSAEEVVQVGPLVLAKNAQKIKISEAKQVGPKGGLKIRTGKPIEGLEKLRETKTVFNKGGAVPMNTMAKQMELFDEGGLMDEGGTVDPISGNEVPPGSTQEEVRDDVPAQLSEGEFVFPADVVRYIGLETLMRMRQEAKMGLAQMEAMGQMGNSEEATIPDDLPFDMYDLEVEDDGLEMQVGGSVPAAPTPTSNAMSGTPASTVGGFVNQIQPLGGAVSNLGIAPSPVTAASATQVDPNLQGTQFTPTSINPVTPTFQQQIGAGVVGVDYEFVEYTNEAGQTIRLRKNKATGQMIDPVPEGFSEKVKEEEVVETTPTTGVGTQTTRVADDGGRGDDDVDPNLGASIALGGKAVGKPEGIGIPFTRYAGPSRRTVGATTFNVQFDIPGFTPNPVSIGSFYKDMLSKDGAGLPKDGVARISVRGGTVGAHKVRVSAIDYNKIRNDVTGNLAKDYQAAGNLAEALQNGSITYDGSKQSFVDNDGNKISDDLAKGLDILGESIYADVRDDTDKGDSMIEAGQNLSASEKSALSAYNDKQFSDFFDDGGKDDTPSAPSGPSAGTPGSQASQVGVGRGPGGEDRGGGRDTSVDRGGPGASPERGDTGRNTAR